MDRSLEGTEGVFEGCERVIFVRISWVGPEVGLWTRCVGTSGSRRDITSNLAACNKCVVIASHIVSGENRGVLAMTSLVF